MKNKKLFTGLLLLASSGLAQADPSVWNFEYRGFRDAYNGSFVPSATLKGVITGDDLNHDGFVTFGELDSLKIIVNSHEKVMSYTTCYVTGTINDDCRVPYFELSDQRGLYFTLTWNFYGQSGYEETHLDVRTSGTYNLDHHAGREYEIFNYYFDPQTQFTLERVSPVPEPGQFAMLGAGLLGLAGWHRRQRHG